MSATVRATGRSAVVILATLLCSASQASPVLPYQAAIGSSQDNQLLCHNCGGSGKQTLIQGGDDVRLYHFVVETPYYTFLARQEHGACPYTAWIAVNKTRVAPYTEHFTVGCYPTQDFRASDGQNTTTFSVYFRSGVTESIVFNHYQNDVR
ncbi:hypothetical protein [Serratia rubidaea]|uniref:hypothetical protein n=1 Tax=Serratia rubidaea TaxID=61652 RepID=UPI0022B900F6|nr:hypothetical protein [Serratia rubidaea]WBF46155.1 hypothetical protein OLD77_03545 [Serratia rubidaea]